MQNSSKWNKFFDIVKRFSGINLLWFLFNIPIVVLGLYLFTRNSINEGYTTFIIIMCIAPFTFFPATSAMFGVVRKYVMGEEVAIVQSFWKYYKENYLRSLSGGIPIIVAWSILAYFYHSYFDINPLLNLLFFILAVVLLVYMLNFFSMTVHMETKLFASLKSSIVITVGGPILTIAVGLISAAIIYIHFNVLPILIPFFLGSIIAHIAFSGFYKVMLSIQAYKERQEEETAS